MLFVKPKHFDDFECIASACTRSCCVGWQIEIDKQAEQKYQKIAEGGDNFILESVDARRHSFLQDNEGRCRMLDKKCLCEIIKRYGEGMLCEICREHPRYYNILPDRVEGGLGLCCITAAESILTMDFPPKYIEGQIEYTDEAEDDDENIYTFALMVRGWLEELLSKEKSLTNIEQIIWNISRFIDNDAFDVATGLSSPEDAFLSLTNSESNSHYSPSFPPFLEDIEVLPRHKDGWSDFIHTSRQRSDKEYKEELYLEAHRRLLFYFLHRYFVTSCIDLSFAPRIILALTLSRLILDVSIIRGATTIPEIARVASEFSESVEYSTDNVALYISRIEQALEADGNT